MRRVIALLVLLFLPFAALAERPHGFAFNRTGLPATLPLLITSPPGRDIYVELLSPAQATVFAAHAWGGEPFRVLVPPGDWLVRLSLGQDWQDELHRFGPGTEQIEIPEPLRFFAGFDRRSGYLIDLRGEAVRISARGLCQGFTRAQPRGRVDPPPDMTVEFLRNREAVTSYPLRDGAWALVPDVGLPRRYPFLYWPGGTMPDPGAPNLSAFRNWPLAVPRDPVVPNMAPGGGFDTLPSIRSRTARVRPWDWVGMSNAAPPPLARRAPPTRRMPARRPMEWLCD